MNDREFDRLVRAHAGAVEAYARALSRDRWAAEEAVQETFLRAWKYLDSFDARGSFEGWLLRICRNCVIDLAARRREHASLDEVVDLRAAAPAPSGRYEVEDLLDRLPIPQREAIVLCGVLGYDYETAATMLDVPIGTVRSRIARGRAALAELLVAADADHGHDGGLDRAHADDVRGTGTDGSAAGAAAGAASRWSRRGRSAR